MKYGIVAKLRGRYIDNSAMVEQINFLRNIESDRKKREQISSNKGFFSILDKDEWAVLKNIIKSKISLFVLIFLLTMFIGIVEGFRSVAIIGLIKTLTLSLDEIKNMMVFDVMGMHIDFIASSQDKYSALKVVMVILLSLTLLLVIVNYVISVISSVLRQSILLNIREKILRKIFTFKLEFFNRSRSGELIFLITAEASRVTSAIYSIKDLFIYIIQAMVFLAILFYLNWKLTLIIVIFSILFYLLNLTIERRIKLLSVDVNERNNYLSHMFHQIIHGIKMIKCGNLEKKEIEEYNGIHTECNNHEVGIAKLNAFSRSFQEIFFTILLVVLVLSIGYIYTPQDLQNIGSELLPYLFMSLRFVAPARGLISARSSIMGSFGSLVRVLGLLKMVDGNDWNENSLQKQINEDINKFDLNDVCFMHSDCKDYIVSNITFSFKRGKRYAIVGHSGGGKSTVLDICAGILKPTSGEILLNNKKLENLGELRNPDIVSYVNQEPIIFHSSVRDNVVYYKSSVTDLQVEDALSLSQLKEFINSSPEGLDLIVGERGLALSGGERQRIGLARSFIQESQIMLIDEGTNALDYTTEKKVYDGIKKISNNKIVIVVAHRISAVKDFDTILVMDKGKIVEYGSHDDLIKKNNYYVSLLNSQESI